MAACRITAWNGRMSSAFRASIASPRPAARLSLWSTTICSISRTASASRPTRSPSTSTIRRGTLIRVFDVAADGALPTARIFATDIVSDEKRGGPDGMKCDERGNVWVTGPGGLWVYAPSGELIGKVRAPEQVANLAWGGPDFHTLFLTASQSVYRVETKVGPRREPYMNARRRRRGRGAGSLARDRASPHPRSRSAAPLSSRTCRTTPSARAAPSPRRRARARQGAERGREHPPRRSGRARERRAGDPCLVHRRARREGRQAATRRCSRAWPRQQGVVRGTWGAAPVKGLEPEPGDLIVEKMTMSAWEGSRLESLLKGLGRDTIINTGAWTNMAVEHTARTGADKGYFIVLPEDCCSTMNAEWHNASINFAMQNVATVTKADAVIKALG